MNRPAPAPGAIAALLAGVIDDAALFPPASLTMEEAVTGYIDARGGEHRWVLGRFVCPASRLRELAASLPTGVEPVGLNLLVDEADAAAAVERAVDGPWRLEAVDTRPPADPCELGPELATLVAAAGEAGAAVFVEVPLLGVGRKQVTEFVAALAGSEVGIKLRCGGVAPDQVPSCPVLAGAICSAAAAGILIRATAGLHHPFRQFDTAGSARHGFLNLVAGVVAADAGAAPGEVEELLASDDRSAFTLEAAGFGWGPYVANVRTLRRIRTERFVGFGSCSFSEPVQHLIALGLLPGAEAVV